MITKSIVKQAADSGLPALKDLFEKLPKEDALKGLAILAILGVGYKIIEAIKDIVTAKYPDNI